MSQDFWKVGGSSSPTDLDEFDDMLFEDDDNFSFDDEESQSVKPQKRKKSKKKRAVASKSKGTQSDSDFSSGDSFSGLDSILDDNDSTDPEFDGGSSPASSGSSSSYPKKIVIAIAALAVISGAALVGSKLLDAPVDNSASTISTTEQDSSVGGSDDTGSDSESSIDDSSSSETTTEDTTAEKEESVGSSISSQDVTGSHDSGTEAIVAYDDAFYHDRDPEIAFEFNSPNNQTTQADLEKSILGNQGVAEGTRYTAVIIPKVLGESYDVKLTLDVPGKKAKTWTQEITTEKIDGKYYVKNIMTLG